MKFRTQWDIVERKREKNSGISKTIPDQSISISALVKNNTIYPGMPFQVKDGIYHDPTGNDEEKIGQETGENIFKKDISEVHEELTELANRELDRKEKKRQEDREKAKKILEKRDNELKEKWLKENQQPKQENPTT